MNGMHDGEVLLHLLIFFFFVLFYHAHVCMTPILVTADLLQLHAHQCFSAEIIITQNLLLCEATPHCTYIRG